MRVQLMLQAGERESTIAGELADPLIRDLSIDPLLDVMAHGDDYLRSSARAALLRGLPSTSAVRYRQDVLADCLTIPPLIRGLYDLAVRALSAERRILRGLATESAEPLLRRSIRVMGVLLPHLARLRALLDSARTQVHSEGLRDLCTAAATDLDADFFTAAQQQLTALSFPRGMVLSGRLEAGGHGTGYVLRSGHPSSGIERWLPSGAATRRAVKVAADDEAGRQAIAELRGFGIRSAAITLAQSADHIVDFFAALRRELAFFVGCLNVHDALAAVGGHVCLPDVVDDPAATRRWEGLYDPILRLRAPGPVMANDGTAGALLVVSGANEGGKTTFLRSLGLAQLMAQAGMFVPARTFRAPLGRAVVTHFRREEDADLSAGKLEEELARFSRIVDAVTPGALLLSNESFASTNEQEGASIAAEVVTALIDAGVSVALVTHLQELLDLLAEDRGDSATFLRTETTGEGRPTFRLVRGRAEPDTQAETLFRRIVGDAGTSQPS